MRVLTKSDKNELKLRDTISNSNLSLFYRMPSTSERVEYASKTFKKVNGEIISDNEIKLEYALKVLTGIGENSFADENGNPISSDPASADYRENWKDMLKENAEDVLMALASQVFENLYILGSNDLPLEKNSGGGSGNVTLKAEANA